MRLKICGFIFGVFAFLLLNVQNADSQACPIEDQFAANRPTVCSQFNIADAVFIGTVKNLERVVEQKDSKVMATFQVVKTFKGELENKVVIKYDAPCSFKLEENKSYLLYVEKENNGWQIRYCGRNKPVENAFEDLKYFENFEQKKGQTRLAGKFEFPFERQVIPSSKVEIVGEKESREVWTDERGFFEIYDLPTGKYQVRPKLPADLKISTFLVVGARKNLIGNSEHDIKFELSENSCVEVNVFVEFDNRIKGKVISGESSFFEHSELFFKEGELKVRLLKVTDRATLETEFSRLDELNINGEFDFTGVPEGDYLLMLYGSNYSDIFEQFSPVFYPNALKKADAVIISISKTGKLSDFDIRIPQTHPIKIIKGKVFYADGTPAKNVFIEFLVGGKPISDETWKYLTKEDGSFALPVYKGLKGKLRALQTFSDEAVKKCPYVKKFSIDSEDDWHDVRSNEIEVLIDSNSEEFELKFPFKPCLMENETEK